MILSCPSCKTRYVVPDSAIGATGRRVRCANCRYSWMQEPPALDLDTATTAGQTAAAPRLPAPAAPAPRPEPPVPPSWAQAEPASEPAPEPEPEAVHEEWAPGRRPRRNRAKMWTIIAIAAGLLMIAGVVALQVFGLPAAVQRIFLPVQNANALTINGRPERTRLESGQDLLVLHGEITNTSDEPQRVPQIRAELRDGQGRVVYSWSIAPPVRDLAPRRSVRFDSAERDVPAGGRQLSLSFGPIS
jgi:predicted Zn finger-like uncharacterized protein